MPTLALGRTALAPRGSEGVSVDAKRDKKTNTGAKEAEKPGKYFSSSRMQSVFNSLRKLLPLVDGSQSASFGSVMKDRLDR